MNIKIFAILYIACAVFLSVAVGLLETSIPVILGTVVVLIMGICSAVEVLID